MKYYIPIVLGLALAMSVIATPAFAYIDPGTGSFLVQGIIAAVIGGGMVIKLFWKKIVSVFTGKSIADEDDDE